MDGAKEYGIDRQHEELIQEILDVTRNPLRVLLEMGQQKFDEVFGYVLFQSHTDPLVTVVPVAKTADFVEAFGDHPHLKEITEAVGRVASVPSDGRLRTIVHLNDGLFFTSVQLYDGARA